jgi:hypothetical protein
VSARSEKPTAVTSALAPDLDAVRAFIADMIAKGAIAALVTSIVALLVKMRDRAPHSMRTQAPMYRAGVRTSAAQRSRTAVLTRSYRISSMGFSPECGTQERSRPH